MDFALSSSAVLGAAVFLWLLWVAPYVLRRVRPAGDGAVLLREADDGDAEPAVGAPSAGPTFPRERRDDPPVTPTARQTPEGEHVNDRIPTAPRLRIRWGRCALAGIGLGGLLVAIIGGGAAAFGVVSGLIPLVALAATAGCFVVLRGLAVRDRRRRVDAAFRAAVRAEASGADPVRKVPVRTANEVFDLQPEPEAVAPLSRDQLRAAALEVAKAAQEAAAEAASGGDADADEQWEPVEVPKPSYVGAAKADRDAPEPLEAPEQPKPSTKVTIKPKPDAAPAPGIPVVAAGRSGTRGALGNLDAVLQRRRA
ncbi:hypothetical protein SPF06_01255 [Sinomonas sp. JGH33]|uniref:Uncharacterized protein n=1 Tax=Sinomonas terricola TaxID=3110330 RepID=A0ABU5T110_9MICC|nr:hypothetical protein [Sinomonas sp. JGH33]MEA5453338.1 hypothetical protein [Sinomonas sp. JGH33]